MRVRAHARRAALTAALSAVSALALTAGASAVAPAPCNGVPQVTDATGDGHHATSDVMGAWFSEASGRLQAVIQVHAGDWKPEHSDADINGAGFAMVFTVGSQTRYVRASAAPDGTLTFDHGLYAAPNTFASLGATTGSAVHGVGGTVTIDVPAALGAGPGAVVADPFVLTYDGITTGVPGWVDQAPGGTLPGDPARGADYVVGSCAGGTGPAGAGDAVDALPGARPGQVASVLIRAPKQMVGGGTATITGRVVPAIAGVDVAIGRRAHGLATTHTRTAADGSFKVRVPVRETVQVRATAGGRRSTTLTVAVTAKARIHVKRLTGGFVRIQGTYAPALPGRALLLGRFATSPTATASVRNGRFSFRIRRSRAPRGGLQVVVIQSRNRAERATSNTVVL